MAKLPPLTPKLETPEAELQLDDVELNNTTTTEAAGPAAPADTIEIPPITVVVIELEQSSQTTDSNSKPVRNLWKTILFYIFLPIVSLLHSHFRYTELYNFPITNFAFWHILPFHLICMVFVWDLIFVLILTLYAVISIGLIHRKFSKFVGLTSQNPFRIQHGILYMMGALYVFCGSAIGMAFAPELSWTWLLADLISTPVLVYGYFMADNRFVRFHISLSMDFCGNRALLADIAISAVFHLVLCGGIVGSAMWKNVLIPWIYCASLLLSSFLISVDYSRVRQEKIYKFQCHSNTKEEYEKSVQKGYSWQLSRNDIIRREERGGC